MEAQNFTFKEKISHYLDDFNSPIGVIVNLIILGLILLSSGIFVIETYFKYYLFLNPHISILITSFPLIFTLVLFIGIIR